MLERPSRVRGRRELLLQTSEDGIIRLRIVDLVSRTLLLVRRDSGDGRQNAYLGARVEAQKGDSRTQLGNHVVRMLGNVWLCLVSGRLR